MAFGFLLVAILAAAITVFALQNGTPVTVKFLMWSREMPIAVLILVSIGTGVVIAGLPLSIARWRLRRQSRALATEVKQLHTALADRPRTPDQ